MESWKGRAKETPATNSSIAHIVDGKRKFSAERYVDMEVDSLIIDKKGKLTSFVDTSMYKLSMAKVVQ